VIHLDLIYTAPWCINTQIAVSVESHSPPAQPVSAECFPCGSVVGALLLTAALGSRLRHLAARRPAQRNTG